jgi:hypothetical protein
MLSNRAYDILKTVATVILPALGALYYALSLIWGLPRPDDVVGTIAAINVFIGAIVGASTRSYNRSDLKYDGTMDVEETDGKKKFLLNFDGDPNDLDLKTAVTFKINSP